MTELPNDEGLYELLPRVLFEFAPKLEITELSDGGRGQFRVANLGDLWIEGLPPHAAIQAKSPYAQPPGGGALSWPLESSTITGLRAAVRDALAFLRAAGPSGEESRGE